ncbi:MAG: DUF711 family protein [Zestosphaera sp.]
MMVRALTLTYAQVDNVGEVLNDLEKASKALTGVGYPPWTVRVTLPEGVPKELTQLLCNSKYLFSAYHRSINEVRYEELRNLMTCRNAFATILMSEWEEASEASELLINLVKDLGYDASTRLGFSVGDYVETPYYPLSTSRRYGASIALRYVDTALQVLKSSSNLEEASGKLGGILRELETILNSTFKNLEIPYLGIDLSLSPWMEESVVPLIEHVSGTAFPNAGSAWGVKALNNLLSNIAERHGIRTLGFNEVMLPVGEDNNLMRLVRDGTLRLSHLTFLTAYCLVGVDMVALPGDKNLIKHVFEDVLAAYEVKRKTVGVRVIPVFNGREVTISRFGTIPVIST